MNDKIENGVIADRFHTESKKEILQQIETVRAEAFFKKPANQQAFMKFLPQEKQLYEVKSKGYSFTEDKDYPVLERRGDYSFKTVEDTGNERWIKEDYFVPAQQNFLYDKECGFTTHNHKQDSHLQWCGMEISTEVPEVRRVKFANKSDDSTTSIEELKTLSGVAKHHNYPAQEIVTLQTEATKEELEKNKELFEKNSKPYYADSHEPKIIKENPLLNDIDKLLENMGKVFPEYRKVDTDGLMTYVQSKILGHIICWRSGVLTVDGAKTNIIRTDVNVAFDGLKKLTTPKMADKLIGKIIVSKLKKLF